MVVDGEEEYEVEAILRHTGKGARHLYLVMWKGYPITDVVHCVRVSLTGRTMAPFWAQWIRKSTERLMETSARKE